MSNKSLQSQVGNLREAVQALLLEVSELRAAVRESKSGEVKEAYVQTRLPEPVEPATSTAKFKPAIGKGVVVHGVAEEIINYAKSAGARHYQQKIGKRGISSETRAILETMLTMTKVGDERAWDIVADPYDKVKIRKTTEYVRAKIHYLCTNGLVPWASSKTKSSYATFVDTVNHILDDQGNVIGHRLIVRRIEPTPRAHGRRWIENQLRGVTSAPPTDESV